MLFYCDRCDNRKIIGFAVDVISIDRGQSRKFESHVILAAHGIWNVENLANADQLPEVGFRIYNMVYRLQEGSGAPTRIFAILEDDASVNGSNGFGRLSILPFILTLALTLFR